MDNLTKFITSIWTWIILGILFAPLLIFVVYKVRRRIEDLRTLAHPKVGAQEDAEGKQ
jgi:hypothetical protein